MIGINFYNKIKWLCGLLGIEGTRMTYIVQNHFIPFVIFLPLEELKMENMTNKILQFGLELCAI